VWFFGWFVPLLRGDWKWFFIMIIALWITFGFASFVLAFFYNKIYAQGMLRKKFKVKNYVGDKKLIMHKAQIKF
jgi:hypothetical protein|tara:strand:+ start:287 stop:508 length:222 start_codon:yes stop_codon:yes gene_type:complete